MKTNFVTEINEMQNQCKFRLMKFINNNNNINNNDGGNNNFQYNYIGLTREKYYFPEFM